MPEHRLSPEEIDRLAQRRAGAKMGWYIHATVFVVVNVGLFAMSAAGLRQRAWNPAPALFWGIGLALHWVSVFVLGKGSSLREHLVRKERERIERAQRDLGP